MKRCSKCKLELPYSEFHKSSSHKDGLSTACRECRNARKRSLYQEQLKVLGKKAFAKKVRERNREFKEKAVEYKGGKCVDCGKTYPSAVYDFHHTDPLEKEANLRVLLRKGFEAAKAELDKCVLLCANCHRLRHFKDAA